MAAFPSPLPVLLPEPSQLTFDEVVSKDGVTVMIASAAERSSACPHCGILSRHIHSRYDRILRDVPWQGSVARIRLRTRRFYCRQQDCRCRVFTQRLAGVAPPYGRQTNRHRDALSAIGYALGGAAGHRLAVQLGFCVSADTILRAFARATPLEAACDVKVLGVDDWAWRRGHRYGTVLVDLERRKPIDLLPDRESETLSKWLKAHPTVEIISRDRAGAYADGSRQGAPNATQIADRFHLLCNLSHAVKRMLERLVSVLQHIQPPQSDNPATNNEPAASKDQTPNVHGATANPSPMSKHELRRQQSQEKLKTLFDAVKAAHRRGLTKEAIARELSIDRKTVRRLLRVEEFPERAPRRRTSQLDKFREYLEKRWTEGCHNASQLCRELRERGYGGQRSRVKEYVHSWRATPAVTPSSPRRKLPNVKLVALWLTKEPAQRSPEEQNWVDAITPAHPHIAVAEELAQQFRQAFRDRSTGVLDTWISRSANSQIPELESFAAGIKRDYGAVSAAVVQKWSNGPVEGQVHRLKLLKRQMYGRGGFALLRRRVLPFTAQHAQRSP